MIRPMTDSDSAFLWETEALRSRRAVGAARTASESRPLADWLTLRQATDVTGIPISTLRKWARRESISSYLEETPVGQLRMISLDDVYRRAQELGREIEGTPPTRPSQPPTIVGEEGNTNMRLTPRAAISPDKAEQASMGDVRQPDIPEGTMLVPLDAWNKMLMQLGNLHDAGQQLAEARERAAKAETEAKFLRERLAELRDSREDAPRSVGAARSMPLVEEPKEPLTHIPLEPPQGETPAGAEDVSGVDIPVRDLGREISEASAATVPEGDDALTLATYSVEMIKHLYSTWRERPRR